MNVRNPQFCTVGVKLFYFPCEKLDLQDLPLNFIFQAPRAPSEPLAVAKQGVGHIVLHFCVFLCLTSCPKEENKNACVF